MSIKLMSMVWDLDLPGSQKIVALALADAASDEGSCYPSIQTIARKSSCGERTVFRVIDILEKLGHLTITRRVGRSSVYTIHPRRDMAFDFPNPRQSDTPANLAPLSGSHPCQPGTPVTVADTPAIKSGAPAKLAPINISYPSPNLKKEGGAVDKSTGESRAGQDGPEWEALREEARKEGFRMPYAVETVRAFKTALRNHVMSRPRTTTHGRKLADSLKSVAAAP